ncbi:MAG: alpha-ketoglutarate-dependent dioxygenase AlkB [Cytophagales bacterium]|nr:alpha-ketoglutarate-dependent dioxygenase AlkB [Cytophagales bacterium]
MDCWQKIPIANGSLSLLSPFLPEREADDLFHFLLEEISWKTEAVRLFGKEHPVPRLMQWFGTKGYRYSGVFHPPVPFPRLCRELKEKVEAAVREEYNFLLLNRYRDGNDCMGWHSDDEKELGSNPSIASFSLGCERDFLIKPKNGRARSLSIRLPHNSLLHMSGTMQQHWLHCLPRRKSVCEERINLTFRKILN